MREPRLVVTRGDATGRAFALKEGDNLVGRADPEAGASPEVDLEEIDVDAKVSRRHAIVSCRGATCSIEDVGSLNGTFLNRGPRLTPGERSDLRPGDEVVIGKTFLRFELAGE
jgi:pSer/pThr/pTyr-binding forkhead associated (FHA) protein